MAVGLAGRAAEEIVFGRVTNGAANDLEKVTQIARAMVFEWGMGEHVTSRTLRADNYALSEETKRLRDSEQANLTDYAYGEAIRLLVKHRVALDRIAGALLEQETLARDELLARVRRCDRDPTPLLRRCRRRPARSAPTSGGSVRAAIDRGAAPAWPLHGPRRLDLRRYSLERRPRRSSTRCARTRKSPATCDRRAAHASRRPARKLACCALAARSLVAENELAGEGRVAERAPVRDPAGASGRARHPSLGVAVEDLDAAVGRYAHLFGAELEHRASVPDQGVETASLRVGPARGGAPARAGPGHPCRQVPRQARAGPAPRRVRGRRRRRRAARLRGRGHAADRRGAPPRGCSVSRSRSFIREATGGVLAELVDDGRR